MKTFIRVSTLWLVFFIAGASTARSQTQVIEGFTFLSGAKGAQVCLGRWIPSRDPALQGVCDGQLVDVSQLAAISASLSADRLYQVLVALASIDQKLAVNNDQIRQLIETTANTQTSIGQQISQVSELLREEITKKFDTLPEEILANDLFREELTKLKKDILKEVEKIYSTQTKPSRK